MTADLYQQAKSVFSELVDLDRDTQKSKLAELEQHSPQLAGEVRSLLEYHTSQSLVVEPVAPKIRTRSTLSTTYQTKSVAWMRGPLRGLLVAGPLFVISIALGLWVTGRVQQYVSSLVTQSLDESVDNRLRELAQWETDQIARAVALSQRPEVVQEVEQLVKLAEKSQQGDSAEHAGEPSEYSRRLAEHSQRLAEHLQDFLGVPVKFGVWDRRMVTVADWNQENDPDVVGSFVTSGGAAMLAPVLQGTAKMYLPTVGEVVSEGYKMESNAPVISIFVPVYSSERKSVIAALMVRDFGLVEQYDELLKSWESKSNGEIYLLNARGGLISRSRYEDLLDSLPLAYDEFQGRKIPLVKDPGVDLVAGKQPSDKSTLWPPTLLAGQIALGNNGANTEGYRNYVGQTVVGAWRWVPEHEFGIAIEEDYATAFAMVNLVRNCFLATAALFTVALIGTTMAVALAALSRRKLRDVSEVGPYQVQELLGEGGMGRVYLAEHALLCRQSAVKVLTKGVNDLSVISRFEREVQLASQLTHPNTISIFDFGRNKDGLFYYAMEYINGSHLGQLVEYEGPIQPGRCIYILRQLCRALNEAHQAGVVHRDIKPQNIMVCNRGGEPDFVKLFDYGLVKAFAPGVSQNPSQTKIVVGTPRFMAPERLNSPWLADPRVDVYSVGSLAYFLLTGQLPPLVTVENGMDSEQPGVETLDLPPAIIDFGGLLSICMSVEPASRPSSMASLLRELDDLSKSFPWSRQDSLDWWEEHEAKLLHLVRNKRKKLSEDEKISQITIG